MAKPRISDDDLCRNAKRINTGVAEIKTFLAVETKNRGFDDYDRPLILFERHWFHRFTRGKFDASHPNISNENPGGYGTSASQYDRFSIAFGLDPNAAMKSASWGLGQVMGFNYAVAGYPNVGAFVDAMKESEGKQLDASINFIIHNDLDDELRRHDWRGFARGYNGKTYEKNDYHNKLARFYKQFSSQPQPNCDGDDVLEIPLSTAAPAVQPAGSHTPESSKALATDTSQETPQGEPPPTDKPEPPPVAVQTVTTEITEQPKTGFKATIAAGIAFLTGAGSGVFSLFQGLAPIITMSFFGAAGLVGAVYIITRYKANENAAQRKAEADEKDKERNHQLQMILAEAARRKDMNTIEFVPPAAVTGATDLPNSDAAS